MWGVGLHHRSWEGRGLGDSQVARLGLCQFSKLIQDSVVPCVCRIMKLSSKEREFHRKIAVDCFNRAWDLMDKKTRSDDDDLLMLHMAHTSRYHWGFVGRPTNRAVGEWQLSRIYAILGQPQLALLFAKSCLQTCEENGLSQIMHTAYEAMARAYAVSKKYREARRYLDRARRQLNRLTLSKDDREVYLDQLAETELLIR